jgi:hypothetical protein
VSDPPNFCPICGGVLQIAYTITFEQCLPKSMQHSEMSENWRLCPGHPLLKLDDEQLRRLAYAFYMADFAATDSQLGRPRLVWNELEEHERAMYMRYAKAAMRFLREMNE